LLFPHDLIQRGWMGGRSSRKWKRAADDEAGPSNADQPASHPARDDRPEAPRDRREGMAAIARR
jgi:hypothetical protein